MKRSLLLLVGILGFQCLQAQFPDLRRMERLAAGVGSDRPLTLRSVTDTLLCTLETRFVPGSSMAWDSSIQTRVLLEEINGYPVLTRTEFIYEDNGSGLEWTEIERTIFYGYGQGDNEFEGVDSVIFQAPDFITGEIVDYGRWYISYTPAGKPLRLDIFIIYTFNGIPLPPSLAGVRQYYYDQDHRLIAIARREVDGFSADLIPVDSTYFQYDANARVQTETVWSWNAGAGVYIPDARNTYTYAGGSADVASLTAEDWNGSAWVNERRTLYVYHKPGLPGRKDIQLFQPSGFWQTVQEVGYTYDAQDRVTQELEQSVAPSGAKTPNFRNRFFYDKQEGWIVETVSQIFSQNNWLNFSRTLLEACDNQGLAPAAPTGLSAVAAGVTSIQLTWNDNSAFELGHRLERSLNGVDFTLIHQTGPDVTDHIDSGLSDATLYYYRVAAYNAGGVSAWSNVATAQTWTTGLEAPSTTHGFRAWFSGDHQLHLIPEADADLRWLSVYDLQGRPMLQADLGGGLRPYDASRWPAGTYLVQVSYGDGRMASRKVARF
jgi:hypothetical protein